MEAAGEMDHQRSTVDMQPSIWQRIFEGLKDLFNMNEQPEDEVVDPFSAIGARQSIHRNRQNDLNASPGVKGRSSWLPNAQLELKRVESGEKVSPKKTDRFRMDPALSTPFSQLHQLNYSHFSQQMPFHQMVNTHLCFCYDENFVKAQFYSQNRVPVDVPSKEVTQYPVIRTVQDESDGCLFAATADIERSRYLKIRGF